VFDSLIYLLLFSFEDDYLRLVRVFGTKAMGVNGLWKLLDPSGKPVPLETLENKVLAVGILYYYIIRYEFDASYNAHYCISLYGICWK
jgi:hypothetical protein